VILDLRGQLMAKHPNQAILEGADQVMTSAQLFPPLLNCQGLGSEVSLHIQSQNPPSLIPRQTRAIVVV
jgi:hypothetical protein